jgi:transcription initiation factor TFIIIB Brf1 subunit/transcription initiation factor TFIIB
VLHSSRVYCVFFLFFFCPSFLFFSEFSVRKGTVIGKGSGNLQRAQNQLKPSAMSTSERNLSDGFQNIRKFETMFSLQRSVVNRARDMMALYEKKKEKTLHGARTDAFALAVIFAAMNQRGQGRSFKVSLFLVFAFVCCYLNWY